MLKRRLWEIVDYAGPEDQDTKPFDIAITVLILLNIVAVCMESVSSLRDRFATAFLVFEALSVAIFSLEYIIRLWSCTVDNRYSHPLWGRLKHATTLLLLVDIIAIVPSYLWFLNLDLRVVRVLRMIRVIRVGKLARYSRALQTLGRVVSRTKDELLVSVSVLLILVFVGSCLMYFAEGTVQPGAFPSIPATMWWTVITLTTVGYGDVYPITTMGKAIAGLLALLGVGLVAMPTGILASGFVEEVQCSSGETRRCKHCDGEL